MITALKKENLVALYPGSVAFDLFGDWCVLITPDEVCYIDAVTYLLNMGSPQQIAAFKGQKDLPAIAKFVINNHRKGENE